MGTELVPVKQESGGEHDGKVAIRRGAKSARKLARQQAKVHAEKFPDILPVFYDRLKEGVDKREEWAMKMVADIAKLTGKSGPMVQVNNNLQQNNVNGGGGRDRSFEKLIRKLEARDHATAEHLTSDVQDAEFDEVVDARPSPAS